MPRVCEALQIAYSPSPLSFRLNDNRFRSIEPWTFQTVYIAEAHDMQFDLSPGEFSVCNDFCPRAS